MKLASTRHQNDLTPTSRRRRTADLGQPAQAATSGIAAFADGVGQVRSGYAPRGVLVHELAVGRPGYRLDRRVSDLDTTVARLPIGRNAGFVAEQRRGAIVDVRGGLRNRRLFGVRLPIEIIKASQRGLGTTRVGVGATLGRRSVVNRLSLAATHLPRTGTEKANPAKPCRSHALARSGR